MSIWIILLIILVCLFIEVLLLGLAFMFGFILPGAFYSDPETYPTIWKNGYMLMLKDMKKHFATNHRFKDYDFGAAIKRYILLIEEKSKENDKPRNNN